MRAALFNDYKQMKLVEKEKPVIGNEEVLIKVERTGICGSEVHAYEGKHPFRSPPSILGHELVGTVVQVGSNVTHVKVEDLVTVEPHVGCGTCPPCQRGEYNVCDNKTVMGTEKWPGSFAEYVKASSETVYPLPSTISYNEAVLTEPLAVGVHACNVAQVRKGDNVVILGAGPIGILTAVAADYFGANKIFITDALEHNLAIVKQLVNAEIINIKQESVVTYLANNAHLIDKVFVTIGLPPVMKEAVEITRKKGTIVSIAIFEESAPIDLNSVFLKELRLLGSSMYVTEDFQKAVNIISEEKYELELLTKHTFPLEQVEQAFEYATNKTDQSIKVLLKPD